MQKYLFKGSAVALRGRVRKPYYQELGEHAAVSTYAGAAGLSQASSRGFALGTDFQYDAAHSEVSTHERDGVYRTSVRSTITNLRVLNGWLTAEKIVCGLESVYLASMYPQRLYSRILPADCRFEKLRVGERDLHPELPPAFHLTEQEREEFLLGKVREEDEKKYYPGFFSPPFHDPEYGTLYFAEWSWVHPGERCAQHLTMLRMALGSNTGSDSDAASGTIDGKGYPPMASGG
jgi:hypothetical protein